MVIFLHKIISQTLFWLDCWLKLSQCNTCPRLVHSQTNIDLSFQWFEKISRKTCAHLWSYHYCGVELSWEPCFHQWQTCAVTRWPGNDQWEQWFQDTEVTPEAARSATWWNWSTAVQAVSKNTSIKNFEVKKYFFFMINIHLFLKFLHIV